MNLRLYSFLERNMQVEECCSALLELILPAIDKDRSGWAIDVGVGTFCFYCERFARLGFRTAAVEPLPVEELKTRCTKLNIQLVETCLSDKNGTATLYKGTFREEENLNLNSLRNDWWGVGKEQVEVKTSTLQNVLQNLGIKRISCLKLDVEGMEFSVVRQIAELQDEQIPKLIMFEYGGGGTKQSGTGGWSADIFGETLQSLNILSNLGFEKTVLIDSGANFPHIHLMQTEKDPERYFLPEFIYGNIVTSRVGMIADQDIISCCLPYIQAKSATTQNENTTIRRKLSKIVKQIFNS
jgi:FkbM family methyltransferase